MARIRTIKPEFWTDAKMVKLSAFARLFFIGCWNFARCDEGHLDDDPLSLKLRILPADDVDVESLLNELLDAGCLVRSEMEGKTFLKIQHFTEHQKIDSRWNTRCPYCSHPNSPELAESHPKTSKEGKGKERKGKEVDMSGKPNVHPPNLSTKINFKQQATEVLLFLNSKAGKNYQPVDANLDLITARLKSGVKVTECKQVIAKKTREWKGDEKMDLYLRPKTLFNKTNFHQYQGELVVPGGNHAMS